jgi:hypothetical protein
MEPNWVLFRRSTVYYGGTANNVHRPGVEDGSATSDGLTYHLIGL